MSDADAQIIKAQSKPAILIVDDDINITRSLARSLRDQFTVFTANAAAEALEIIERERIAVVLTDQRMPGLTGVELLERVRHLRPDAVGIIISGYTDIVALIDAINLGTVRGYIPKPWDIAELRQRLESAVHTYQASFLDPELLHQSAAAVARMQHEITELHQSLDLVTTGELAHVFPTEAEVQSQKEGDREALAPDQPASSPPAGVSGSTRLSEALPARFERLTRRYGELIDLALDQRAFKVNHHLSGKLRALSTQLGQLRAGPRDVVEMHSAALKSRFRDAPPARQEALVEEGRLLLLELMGYLISYYRTHLLASERPPKP